MFTVELYAERFPPFQGPPITAKGLRPIVIGPHFVNRLGYVLCENPVPECEAYEDQL